MKSYLGCGFADTLVTVFVSKLEFDLKQIKTFCRHTEEEEVEVEEVVEVVEEADMGADMGADTGADMAGTVEEVGADTEEDGEEAGGPDTLVGVVEPTGDLDTMEGLTMGE